MTGAHHVDLRFSSKEDPQWLKDVRKQEVQIITKWISQYYHDLAHFWFLYPESKKHVFFFFAKTLFLSFCQKCVLTIFKLFSPIKTLSNFFFLSNWYFFLRTIFLSVKCTLSTSNAHIYPPSVTCCY